MPGFFYNLGYNLGRRLGPKVREANWILRSLTGTEAEAIQAERAVGRDLARAFDGQLDTDTDPEVHDLLTDLGSQLARRVKNREWRFSVQLVKAPEINAFALPGGYVFITRSLVELCERDRHELAFILGHEMGHIVRRHAMDRMMANAALRAVIAGLAPGRGLAGPSLAGLATTFLQQSYSQDKELEADSFGVQLARSAGFDPNAAIRLLGKLGAHAGDAEEGLGSYFSSHPPFTVRVQNLQRLPGK